MFLFFQFTGLRLYCPTTDFGFGSVFCPASLSISKKAPLGSSMVSYLSNFDSALNSKVKKVKRSFSAEKTWSEILGWRTI